MAWRRADANSLRGRSGADATPSQPAERPESSDPTARRLAGIRTGVVLHRERELRAQALDAYNRLDEASERLIAAIVRVVEARAAWAERYEAARGLAERQGEAAGSARLERIPPPPAAPWPTPEEHPTIWTLLQPDAVLEAPDPERLKEEFRSWAGTWTELSDGPRPGAGDAEEERSGSAGVPGGIVPGDPWAPSGEEELGANWLGGELSPGENSADEALPLQPRRLSREEPDDASAFPAEAEEPPPQEDEPEPEPQPSSTSGVLEAFEYRPGEDDGDVVPPLFPPREVDSAEDEDPTAGRARGDTAASPVRTRSLHVAGIGSFSWGDVVKRAPSQSTTAEQGPPQPASERSEGSPPPVSERSEPAEEAPDSDASEQPPEPLMLRSEPPPGPPETRGDDVRDEPLPEPIAFVRPREDTRSEEEDIEAAVEPVFLADDEAFEA